MDVEEEASKRIARVQRGNYRIEVEIEGPRIIVWCRSDCVRVVIKRHDGPNQVETDIVERVDVETWVRDPQLSRAP